ncbi:hypothetical protein GCWU000342_00784 [Shuttleworthella satelles DSM 14600]|uniref:Uncharacterized protein n=1 Tax=Shuttleworthella satelles DSM 14600 TaxID=626523 RepID=C4G9X9_9FIRM|nr:hypothetical protein GCWU000342_00784 [Shuttleworthia satelles DSM 14600]
MSLIRTPFYYGMSAPRVFHSYERQNTSFVSILLRYIKENEKAKPVFRHHASGLCA